VASVDVSEAKATVGSGGLGAGEIGMGAGEIGMGAVERAFL